MSGPPVVFQAKSAPAGWNTPSPFSKRISASRSSVPAPLRSRPSWLGWAKTFGVPVVPSTLTSTIPGKNPFTCAEPLFWIPVRGSRDAPSSEK